MNEMDSIQIRNPEEIGKCIQKIRKSKKISQTQLAEMLGKSMRTIQKYENGEIDFNISVINEICNALETPWYEVLSTSPSQNEPIFLVNENANGLAIADGHLNTLAELYAVLFNLLESKDISFSVSYQKPPESASWVASINVNGKGGRLYDTDFCLFVEELYKKISELSDGTITRNQYDAWRNETIGCCASDYFTDATSSLRKSMDSRHKKKSDLESMSVAYPSEFYFGTQGTPKVD